MENSYACSPPAERVAGGDTETMAVPQTSTSAKEGEERRAKHVLSTGKERRKKRRLKDEPQSVLGACILL